MNTESVARIKRQVPRVYPKREMPPRSPWAYDAAIQSKREWCQGVPAITTGEAIKAGMNKKQKR